MSKKPVAQLRDAARTILTRFLAPLSLHKHHEADMGAYWDSLFDTQNRTIRAWRAFTRFKLPGLYCLAPNVKVQGIGDRIVERSEVLFVRIDDARDTVDVERRKERVFTMTISEWHRQCRPYVEPAELKLEKEPNE